MASIAVWECISALCRLMTVSRTRSRSSRVQSIRNSPAMAASNPFSPSMTSSGPVRPCFARNTAFTQHAERFGYASPFQFESRPVRVTRKALNAVPHIAMALAVRCASRASARLTPAATA